MTANFPYIFVPSYKRAKNIKTLKYFAKIGYDVKKIVIFIDNETPDVEDYKEECGKYGCGLHVFSIDEARQCYDFVHRPTPSRRAAGMARNMMHDYAIEKKIDFFVVIDDDTNCFAVRYFGKKEKRANLKQIVNCFSSIENMMKARHIGCFGLSQSGDIYSERNLVLFRKKIMNVTFYLHPYIHRGERGVQDDDTSQFLGIFNSGLFGGSLGDGIILHQTPSATATGGLTELYNEAKLLNKALVCPIQYPSAVYAEKQTSNGNRIHHRIMYKHIVPKILKNEGGRDNIAWDAYDEDSVFSLARKRKKI